MRILLDFPFSQPLFSLLRIEFLNTLADLMADLVPFLQRMDQKHPKNQRSRRERLEQKGGVSYLLLNQCLYNFNI